MMLSTPSSPRSGSRARLLPGLSLHVGDMLGGRYRLVSLVRADRALVVLHGESSGAPHAVDVHVLVGDAVSESIRMRFVAEARKTASLKGPHVARVLHVGVTSDGHPFIVRERIPELTLASLLEERHSLTTEHAVDLALDVCDALTEAHAHGIAHGELGAHFVHLDWTPEGPTRTKLVGLATARVLAAMPLDASTAFTPVMRAPELLARRDAPADERADVWGLGVLLYTMLAGAPPFAAETPSAVSVSVAAEEQASLAGVPDALAELVDACLAKDRSLRPASIAVVADRLLPFASRPAEALARVVSRPSRPPSSSVVPRAEAGAVAPEPAAPAGGELPATVELPAASHAPGLPATVEILAAAQAPAPPPTVRAIPVAVGALVPDAQGSAPSLASETGEYEAQELARLRSELEPAPESELSIDVEIGASVRDVSEAAGVTADTGETRAASAKLERPEATVETEPEASSTPSAPPVALTVPPPPAAPSKTAAAPQTGAALDGPRPLAATLAPRNPRRSWRLTAALAAAACLAGIVIGVNATRASGDASARAAGAEAPAETARLTPPPAAVEIAAPAAPAATAPALPAALAVGALPAASPAPSPAAPTAKGAPKPALRALPSAASPTRPASAPAARPSADLVRSASAPIQPEPKANDDDLRRFLDDRR